MTTKREIFAFCLFDFANSAYTTLIITTLYSAYFAQTLGSSFLWSMTLAASHLLVLIASPIGGAMADAGHRKKRYLSASTLLCVVTTALLFFCTKERLPLAILFVILSNAGFSFTEVFVSSFLPDISTGENIGRVSGMAWGFGYVGGIASLLMCLWYLSWQGFTDSALRFTTILTAAFFGLFALPSLLWLKEKPSGGIPLAAGLFRESFRRLAVTFRDVRAHGELFKFLTAFFLYSCGTATVISFASIFAQTVLAFDKKEILMLILVSNLTAAAGALMFGFVQDKIGAKRTLSITLFLWLAAVGGAFFVREKSSFWLVANVVGVAMGASQSAGRSLVGLFSPPRRASEFFGFWGVASRASSVAGLFSFGLFLRLSGGNMRASLLFTAAFFVSGWALLYFVDEKKGRKM